ASSRSRDGSGEAWRTSIASASSSDSTSCGRRASRTRTSAPPPETVSTNRRKRRADEPAGRSAMGAWLARFSLAATEWAGSSWAFGTAVAVILVWGLTGPIFHFSDTWQLVINTGTTIVTFVMVFLIQRAQNKESKAVQLKLNEIVAAIHGAS